ncbi:MAG: NAD(P)H-quinone oxidoreductase [Paracoccaceae bacterium]
MMNVIEISTPGGPEVLRMATRPLPVAGPGEVVIEVAAIGLNRPDVQQRRGLYPAPKGASDLPGLDIAGTVTEIGKDVDPGLLGTDVCALTNGGGYAEYCAVPALQTLRIPKGFSFVQAASLPEVYMTAWNNVVMLGRLAKGDKFLVQGGTSGVGMAALQIANQLYRATTFATAGSKEKRDICIELGAAQAFDYHDPDWAKQALAATNGQGMDVILDHQAGPYTQTELDLLNFDGRLVLIASHQSKMSEVNTGQIVRRRLTLCGSTLRPRPAEYKAAIGRELVENVWPLLESGTIKTYIFDVFAFDQMQDAHRVLDENRQIGKLVVDLSK